MDADGFVVALLGSLPHRQVRGKKRLQKLSYLLKESGTPCPADFVLKDFGPYSTEIARGASLLAATGQIQERSEEVGPARRIVSVYTLSEEIDAPMLDENSIERLRCFNNFSTIELEIAATIQYFIAQGSTSELAEEQTKRMKPTKAKPIVLSAARKVLGCL